MEIGDLVWFPCDIERYQPRVGVLLGFHDNKADVSDPTFSLHRKKAGMKPRQVADVLYRGKLVICWAANVKEMT
jgi:hypothetical protein